MDPSHSIDMEESAENQLVHNESGLAQEDAATGKNGDQGVQSGQGDQGDQDDQGDQGDKDNINSELKETHMVVATLIATVSFAAGFTMPGGYQGDKGPDQGFAVLTRNAAFQVFVITNTIAMSLSSCSVMMQLYWMYFKGNRKGMPKGFKYIYMCTLLALMAMVVAFMTGTYAVLGHSSGLGIAVCVLCAVLFFILTECLTFESYDAEDEVKGPHFLGVSILFWLVLGMMLNFFHKFKDAVRPTG